MCVDVNHYLCFREWWKSYEGFGLFELVGLGLGWVNLNKLKKQIGRCRKRQKTEWLSSSQGSDVGSAKSLRHILFHLCCWMETDVQQGYLRSFYLWSCRMSFYLLLVDLDFIIWGSVLLLSLALVVRTHPSPMRNQTNNLKQNIYISSEKHHFYWFVFLKIFP